MNEKGTTPTLRTTNKSTTLATQARVQELAEKIAKEGYGRQACLSYAKDKWGVKKDQSERYYYAALKYLVPEEPEKYRQLLIDRNFTILENMLQKALDGNDLSAATQIIKLMNTFLGVSDKKLEVDTKDTKITVSFGE